MNSTQALAMAIGGGFSGTTIAALIAWFVVRSYVRSVFKEILHKAHIEGTCPVCKQATTHHGPFSVTVDS